MAKLCAGRCARTLPEDDEHFYPDPRTAGSYRARCRDCYLADQKDARSAAMLADLRAGGESLLVFGTPIERTCAEALLAHGNVADAAESVQLSARMLRSHLTELTRRAAERGWSPGRDVASKTPEGYHVKGVSSYYRVAEDGTRQLAGQWVKTNKDADEHLQSLISAVGVACADFATAPPAPLLTFEEAWARMEAQGFLYGPDALANVRLGFDMAMAGPERAMMSDAAPEHDPADLLCVYPMGDPHLGMYAWAEETGASHFDLEIAERNLVAAVDHLVASGPPADTGLIVNVGDFFHYDNKSGTTTAGTRLDADTRWRKVLQTGVRAMCRCINRALRKHKLVRVINEIGNHDEHSSLVLSLMLDYVYKNEPRVQIDVSPERFHWFRFGLCLIGVTHGESAKVDKLLGVMAVDRAKDWGETLHRYFYTGHIHHDTVKELPGVKVESFRTLAPRDDYHARSGYRSGQDMKMIVLHKQHGEIRRHTVTIPQLTPTTSTEPQ
jgi:hypothetical protein